MALPFIEIIETTTADPNLLMWKFEDADAEIKNGAKLTVRESQHAMLLNEGKLGDVFPPGLYSLKTQNIPILSSIKGWKYGFESPFKADIYFFNTHQFINNKWGTPAPILLRDPQFGQVRVRAFGSFDIKIADVSTFFRQYAGTYKQLTIFELQNQLRDFIAPKFGEILAQQNISVLDVAGNITELSKKIEPHLKPYFLQLGIELTQFIITSVTLPEEVTAHYDKMTNMNMVTDMDKFTKFNTANAIGQAGTAANEGTQNAMMMGMMMNQLQNNQPQQEPSVAVSSNDITVKLQKLKTLFDGGLIDETEYKEKKTALLSQL
jgi:membrane protease subunit (stomatin/prohibitin family)